MFKKSSSVFEKIDLYLRKKSHEKVLSIYLNSYNGNDIYIRFDYVRNVKAYKIIWIDFNFFDIKKIEQYINVQTVTSFIGTKLDMILAQNKDIPDDFVLNSDILGDRVEILSYIDGLTRQYVFDRFLPLKWDFLIDPLVMIFSYLPRSMDCILSEIFGKFDKTEEKYNYLKPIRFSLIDGDEKKIFRSKELLLGNKYFDDDRVVFLEKVENRIHSIVEGRNPYSVLMIQINSNFSIMRCSCGCNFYCKHIYASLLALRNGCFKNFYKVKYIGKEETLLEKVTNNSYSLCFGVENDNLLIVNYEGNIISVPIIQDGKCVFEVIEDDDECSLSKLIKDYKSKK